MDEARTASTCVSSSRAAAPDRVLDDRALEDAHAMGARHAQRQEEGTSR